ncbi:hypothetical protein NEOKW01_0459 [Nematocida sp. AWRm80]|nr:hypothetical protein NEOKW01_0459 [Nematocida sp. AWRm80]
MIRKKDMKKIICLYLVMIQPMLLVNNKKESKYFDPYFRFKGENDTILNSIVKDTLHLDFSKPAKQRSSYDTDLLEDSLYKERIYKLCLGKSDWKRMPYTLMFYPYKSFSSIDKSSSSNKKDSQNESSSFKSNPSKKARNNAYFTRSLSTYKLYPFPLKPSLKDYIPLSFCTKSNYNYKPDKNTQPMKHSSKDHFGNAITTNSTQMHPRFPNKQLSHPSNNKESTSNPKKPKIEI